MPGRQDPRSLAWLRLVLRDSPGKGARGRAGSVSDIFFVIVFSTVSERIGEMNQFIEKSMFLEISDRNIINFYF